MRKYTLVGTIEIETDDAGEPVVVRVLGVLPSRPPPGIPTDLRVVEATETLVRLAWFNGGNTTSWTVYRDDGAGGAVQEYDTVTVPEYVDTGVDPDTTYVYQVLANNPTGSSDLSDPVVAITTAPGTPAKPTELEVIDVTARSVTFVWGDPGDAFEWDVFRSAVYLATVEVPIYSDDTVAQSSAYSYTVVARNAAGDSDASDPLEVSTPANSPPVWSDTPAQSGAVGQNFSLNLSGLSEDPDEDPLTYSVQSGAVPGLSINGNLLTGTFTEAGNFTPVIRANDGLDTADAEFAFEVAAVIDTTPPTVPQNAAATANGSTVTLTWDPSTDAQSGVRRYRIRRNNSFIAYADGPPFVDLGVPNGSYTYHVRAEDNANYPADGNVTGNSNGAPVVVSIVNPVPDTPINFAATPFSATRIDLSWAAGPSGAAPTDYDVDFSTVGPSGPWTALPVTGTGTTFSHTGLSQIQHWYRLRANNGATPSAGYATATATPTGGSQAANFIIAAGTKTFNCASATDVNGTTRKVQPGEVVQINDRTPTNGLMLKISNPEGTAGNPIVFRPPLNARCTFKRSAPGGGFVVQISGSMTNPNLHGGVVFDGFSSSSNVPVDPVTGLRYGFRFQPANGSDNPTGWLDVHGFVKNVTLRYIEFDCAGHGGSGFSPNTNTLGRTDFPGVFKGPFAVQFCKFVGTSGAYIGSNYQNANQSKGGLPVKDVLVEYSYWTGTEQTPILVKNCWEGFCHVHHNVVISPSIVPSGAVQKNGIRLTGCVGECHHNWVENVALNQSGGAQSPNHAMPFGTTKGPSLSGDPGYNGGNPYPFLRMKVYSNVLFTGSEMGINCASSGTVRQLLEVYNNTVDNFAGYGIQLSSSVHPNSFAINNIVTRCRPSGSQVNGALVDASKNFLSGNRGNANSTLSSIFVNVAAKDYHLVNARPVASGSVLGTNVATSDYDGVARSTVVGADMGAYERA